MEKELKIRMNMPREDIDPDFEKIIDTETLEIKTLEDDEQSLVHGKFVDPVTFVVGLSIAVIGKLLIERWLKKREKGVLIDTRKVPPIISKINNVPRGTLWIIDQNNEIIKHKPDYEKPGLKLIEDILGILKTALTLGSG